MEHSYLLFKTGGLYFMVPLEKVGRIDAAERKSADELPVYDMGILSGKKKRGNLENYVLMVTDEEGSFGIYAERIEGVRKVEESQVLSLSPPVIWKGNDYLSGVVMLHDESRPLAYLLDINRLGKRTRSMTDREKAE